MAQNMTSSDLSNMSSEDFAEAVLYCAPGEKNSDRAIKAQEQYSFMNIATVDVFQAEKIPDFVQGVPTLHLKAKSEVLTGSQVFEFLASDSPVPVATTSTEKPTTPEEMMKLRESLIPPPR